MTNGAPRTDPPLHGIVAEYADPEALKAAAARVRDAGFKKFDCYSPFPVHGIDPAMGIRPTRLPWLILACGLVGCFGALWMQWWMNAVDYPFMISGKPLFSLPANVPVIFELTVLLSAFGAFFGALILNDLPRLHNPLFNLSRFRKATDNGFFLAIDASDPGFEEGKVKTLLGEGAVGVEACYDEDPNEELPPAFWTAGLILFLVALVPLGLAMKSRNSTSKAPRLHVFTDMDFQPMFKAQRASALFPDGRAMRLPVPGTVAVEDVAVEGPAETGKENGAWLAKSPVPWTVSNLKAGRKAYDIHCAVCHGATGRGDGPVALRARELAEAKWVAPTNLLDARIRGLPPGQVFDVITNGIRNMPAYAAQIPVEERWMIVGYLKALQRSRNATIEDVPADRRKELK